MKTFTATYTGNLSIAEAKRFVQRGAFVVVHHQGDAEDLNGALFTTALVALPGESSEECVRRHGHRLHGDDVLLHYNIDLQLPTENQ